MELKKYNVTMKLYLNPDIYTVLFGRKTKNKLCRLQGVGRIFLNLKSDAWISVGGNKKTKFNLETCTFERLYFVVYIVERQNSHSFFSHLGQLVDTTSHGTVVGSKFKQYSILCVGP